MEPPENEKFPQLTAAQTRLLVEKLREARLSGSKIKQVIDNLHGGNHQVGTSTSNTSRHGVEVSGKALAELRQKRFDKEKVVAVQLDGTRVGEEGDERTVLIAVGLTVDGRRLVLGACIAQHEKGEDVLAFLRGLVRRGIDPRVLWTSDGGEGIRFAIEAITGGDLSRHQICTTHAAGQVAKKVPKELIAKTRQQIYSAFRTDDTDTGLGMAETLAEKLEAAGHHAAAKTIRSEYFQRTFTVNRLGLPHEARLAVRSTNDQERLNGEFKAQLENVKRWRSDTQILRWTAEALALLEPTWNRAPALAAFVDFMEREMPGLGDPEAERARLPPSVSADSLAVPLDDARGKLPEWVSKWCERVPGASWDGATHTLGKLGLKAGEPVTPERLLKAMKRIEAETAKTDRPGMIDPPDDPGSKDKIPGVRCLTWTIEAPPLLTREWAAAGPARRAEIEAALLAAVEPVVSQLTRTTNPNHGFAAARGLIATEGAEGVSARLAVRGVAVAVTRGREARIDGPVAKEARLSSQKRAAEDIAKEILDSRLGKVPAAEKWLEPEPPSEPSEEEPSRPEDFPQLTPAQIRFLTEQLREARLSGAKIEKLITDLHGGVHQRGTSTSAISRDGVEAGEKALADLRKRRFDDEPIVAVQLDGTWVGNKRDKRTVLIAVGLTADGRRLLLGAWIAQDEKSDVILAHLRGLVDRGVDPRVLWTSDGGEGIRAAIKAITGGDLSRHQICTTHAARNVAENLPEELEGKYRLRLFSAWHKDDEKSALAELESVAEELETAGHHAAAKTIRGKHFQRTVTVNRLGLPHEARLAVRSTNDQERLNNEFKEHLRNVMRWRDDEHILRWVAESLTLIEPTWTRTPASAAFVDFMEREMPGLGDAEAVRATVPPTVSAEALAVPLEDARGELPEWASKWCERVPGATWGGATHTLGKLGLERGETVTPERLLKAMKRIEAETGETERPGMINPPDDPGSKKKIPGVRCLTWTMEASPLTLREWLAADPAQRKTIETALLAAAGPAVSELTLSTDPNHGVAAARGLIASEGADGEGARLAVTGIAVAVTRGKEAKISSPIPNDVRLSSRQRAAEDAAKEMLDSYLGRQRAQAVAAAETAPPSQELLDGVDYLALWKAPRMVGLEQGELERLAATVAERRAALELNEPELDRWLERDGPAAIGEIVAARAKLSDQERKGDIWWPLTPRTRIVLGEARSQRLLSEAAYLRGVIDVNGETASEAAPASDALDKLAAPIARADALAEALAASRELERRHQLESVLAQPTRTEKQGAVQPFERGGRAVEAPAERYRDALGRGHSQLLSAFGKAITSELERLDNGRLQALSRATEKAWKGLNTKVGLLLGRLGKKRDVLLEQHLRERRELGRSAARAADLEAQRRGGEFFAETAKHDQLRERSRVQWEELRANEAEQFKARAEKGSPQRLRAEAPEMALHQAAQALLLERARAAELARAADPPAPALAAGPEIGA